jgi:hypothetical protein
MARIPKDDLEMNTGSIHIKGERAIEHYIRIDPWAFGQFQLTSGRISRALGGIGAPLRGSQGSIEIQEAQEGHHSPAGTNPVKSLGSSKLLLIFRAWLDSNRID